jgi:hypothetical protein
MLSRWKFDPRLLSIKAGNTRVAEGLHHIRDNLTTLEANVKDARAKFPQEQVPQAKLISDLSEKASDCARRCSDLQNVKQCSQHVSSGVDSLAGDLGQLKRLLTEMQNTGSELRSFSFDGVAQLLSHSNRAMARLEKQALAENNSYFWPWVALFFATMIGGTWLMFNPSAGALNVFGDASQLHKMVMELVGFLGLDAGLALIIYQVYRCFKPMSPGLANPSPIYPFWGILAGTVYGFWSGLMIVIWSFSLAVWMSGNPAPDWWGFITVGGLLVMLVSGILFVVDCVDPPK